MNKKGWAAHRGIFIKRPQSVIDQQNLFDFRRAVKEELNLVHVPFHDVCEDCPVSDSETPVRYNIDNEIIEYWNGTTWTDSGFRLPSESSNVTQITSPTTTVNASTLNGVITTVALTTAAGAYFEFTLSNTLIFTTSVIQLTGLNSGTGQLNITLVSVNAGNAVIRVGNVDNSEAFNSLVKIHYRID